MAFMTIVLVAALLLSAMLAVLLIPLGTDLALLAAVVAWLACVVALVGLAVMTGLFRVLDRLRQAQQREP